MVGTLLLLHGALQCKTPLCPPYAPLLLKRRTGPRRATKRAAHRILPVRRIVNVTQGLGGCFGSSCWLSSCRDRPDIGPGTRPPEQGRTKGREPCAADALLPPHCCLC